MSKANEIVLGNKYKDKITGFVGTAIQRYDLFGSRAEIGLLPTVDAEGKVAKPLYVDASRVVTPDGAETVLVPLPPQDIILGDEYRDDITGFTGRATSRLEHINGCIQWGIDPPVDKDGKTVEGFYFDDARLVSTATGKVAVKEPAPVGNSTLTPSR